MNTYKYFLIFDRNKNVIYGECIKWEPSEHDTQKKSNLSIGLKGKFKARVFTAEKRLEDTNPGGKELFFIEGIKFNYLEEYQEFITQRNDESLFTPLIDRCSVVNMYIGNQINRTDFHTWSTNNRAMLDDVKSKFDIDLLRHPELINSYSYYEPTRIHVSSKFIDKKIEDPAHPPQKLHVAFYDELQKHSSARYSVTGYFENGESQTTEGCISEASITIDFARSPEELEIIISEQDTTIYSSKHGFLKSIEIRSTVIGSSVDLGNGTSVTKYTESTFSIGDKQ